MQNKQTRRTKLRCCCWNNKLSYWVNVPGTTRRRHQATINETWCYVLIIIILYLPTPIKWMGDQQPNIWMNNYEHISELLRCILILVSHLLPPSLQPSTRPESDFTLDVPRAEQLQAKMKKDKQFRNRCRIITSFLSLIFFLLTVMVVSLVLTRGKRMFGSMI